MKILWTLIGMLGDKMKNLIPKVLIVLIAALVGTSIGKVTSFDLLLSATGGAVIAVIAVGIAALFGTKTSEIEKNIPPRQLLGMRIAVVGFIVAVFGWVITVFVSQSVGYFMTATGIITGQVGIVVHFFNMFWNRKKV